MTVQGPVKEQQPDGMSHRGSDALKKENSAERKSKDKECVRKGAYPEVCSWLALLIEFPMTLKGGVPRSNDY